MKSRNAPLRQVYWGLLLYIAGVAAMVLVSLALRAALFKLVPGHPTASGLVLELK